MMPREVAEILPHLDEPWRSRFLKLIVQTTIGTWDGRNPTQKELTEHLERDSDLCRWTLRLLYTWGAFKDRNR